MLRSLLAGPSARNAVASTSKLPAAAAAICWCQRPFSSSRRRQNAAETLQAAGEALTPAQVLQHGQEPFATSIDTHFETAEVHLPLTQWPVESSDESQYVSLPAAVFDSPPRPDILHQCVRAHLASLRQGTARTKNRAEVRGSQKKIMRQKGTGKARVGDRHSPIRRGGGRAFPKRPKDWSLGLNRKVWEMGVRTALSERWRRGELLVIPQSPTYDTVSTRELVASLHSPALAAVPQTGLAPSHRTVPKVLFLLSELDPNMEHSARNLQPQGVNVLDVRDVDVYPLLLGSRVVLDIGAAQYLSTRFGKSNIQEILSQQLEELRFRDDEQTFDGEESEEVIELAEDESAVDEIEYEQLTDEVKIVYWENQISTATANGDIGLASYAQSMHDSILAESANGDGQTSPESQGRGVKDQDVVVEGEEAGVQEQRHPEDPLKPAAEDKGEAIRQEMDKAAKKQKDNVESEDRPSAKEVL